MRSSYAQLEMAMIMWVVISRDKEKFHKIITPSMCQQVPAGASRCQEVSTDIKVRIVILVIR